MDPNGGSRRRNRMYIILEDFVVRMICSMQLRGRSKCSFILGHREYCNFWSIRIDVTEDLDYINERRKKGQGRKAKLAATENEGVLLMT
jgi:hypothetical protein